MIEFVKGPLNNDTLSSTLQDKFTKALLSCNDHNSKYFLLNLVYNNYNHFSNPSYNIDPVTFLNEVVQIASSKNSKMKIVVMGGEHQDTGHHSNIVQHHISNHEASYGCFVKDTYIRFRVELDANNIYSYNMNTLNSTHIFHFITDVPEVIWTKNKKGYVYFYISQSIPISVAKTLYPKTTLPVKRIVY